MKDEEEKNDKTPGDPGLGVVEHQPQMEDPLEDDSIELGEPEIEEEGPGIDQADDPKKPGKFKQKWNRFTHWYKSNKVKSIPLTILAVVLLLAALPWTRYPIAGLGLKKNVKLTVVDATAGAPVSGADVSLGGVSANTDSSGKVTLRQVRVGNRSAVITKKYYKDKQIRVLVPILSQKTVPKIELTATGRQVKVVVSNLINHKKLAEAEIKVAGISAKTDASGGAVIVLPAGTSSAKAALVLNGYNDAEVTISVDDKSIKENDFSLTPSGSVYFLSKASGKIDLVKTNLDGTARKTILAGTGKEDDRNTVLLAARSWKYLALLSKRDGTDKLYLLDTSGDSTVTMDEGTSASFNPIGWSNDNFVYTVTRQDIPSWQAKAQALKSYNATTKQITILDQTKADGTTQSDSAYESYGSIYQIGQTVVYEKGWTNSYYLVDKLSDKQAGIYSINANGSNPQTLKTFGYTAGQGTFISSVPYESTQIYYQATEKGGPLTYYSYGSGKITPRNDIADKYIEYDQNRLTYLLSPSGNNTFWSEPRDGKNTLLIGDDNADNGKQIATLSDYQTYGWYTDDYLLVSKNGSELSIMPKSGLTGSDKPLKISDYHKPVRNFLGYGGGYGGI